MKKVSESDVSSKLDISRMAGEAITKMGFLPDSRLFSKKERKLEKLKNEKLEKRLLRNANISLRRNPSTGREVELEKILEQVDKFVERFDPNGDLAKKFSISDPGPISESMKNYIESWSLNLESDVEYELWDELFKSRKPAKLGEQVRAEIEQWSSDVEDEFMTSPIEFFDEMNVEQGLNDKEATSAIKFIDHPQIRYVVGGDGIRLINVLESATRNRVIKLANSRVDKSKDGLYAFWLSMELSPKTTIGQSFILDTLQDTPPRMTLAFFNFLYAETLLDISERADGEGTEFRTPFLEDNARSSRSLIEVYDEIKAFSQQTPTSDELLEAWGPIEFLSPEIILMKTRK